MVQGARLEDAGRGLNEREGMEEEEGEEKEYRERERRSH